MRVRKRLREEERVDINVESLGMEGGIVLE